MSSGNRGRLPFPRGRAARTEISALTGLINLSDMEKTGLFDFCLTRLCLCLPLVATLAVGACCPASAAITLPPVAQACVQWAAQDVESALTAAGAEQGSQVEVRLQPSLGSQALALVPGPESVTVVGGDSVGAMYGLFELSEQIRNSGAHGSWSAVLAKLHITSQRPFLQFRADNPFLHATDKKLVIDLAMWKPYIDMLARDRFNVLDLHGPYNLTSTQFPNMFPLLVPVPEYPHVGDLAQQTQNLADFKELVEYAQSRGVQVSLMNYSIQGMAPRGAAANDYLAHAVAVLLKAVPDLKMIGFRVGESGENTGSLEKAYLRGIQLSGRTDVHLYTRSWLTPEKDIDKLGQDLNGSLDVEIKYNGEQLGLPYQALGKGYGSYSYQNYIRCNAPYRIIWQVRANGTHRFWAWGDTNFIRRCVKTLTLGRALGFSLEPHMAYFDYHAASYYRSAQDQSVYHYIWQKNWMWYYLWGRIAYNPAISEETLVSKFRQHYGPQGPDIYNAMQAAGPIVPLICAYRFQGPDQRQWSPELESGCFVSGDPKWWFQSLQRRQKQIGVGFKYNIDVTNFSRQGPMDGASFASIRSFVDHKLKGEPDGRIGPGAVVEMLTEAAQKTRNCIEIVGNPTGRTGDEWRLLKTDLYAASCLADYYAHRILGSTHLEYALQTGSQIDYNKAVALFASSRQWWNVLAAATDSVYAPLNDGMRHQWVYTWGMQSPMLEQLDATAPAVWAGVKHVPGAAPLKFTPADLWGDNDIRVVENHSIWKGRITITFKISADNPIKEVDLWHRPLPSESNWSGTRMIENRDGLWNVTIPIGQEGMIFFIFVENNKGECHNFPNPMQKRPFWLVDPWEVAGIH